MTAPSHLLDLDDSASVTAADSEGSLRSAALGGAQVRATAEAVSEGALDRIRDLRPRSIVLVTGGGRAGRAASVLTSALGARIGVPILHLPAVPPWVGSLDVVIVAGEDAGDPRLLTAVDSALRRGAEVVIAAPDEGPLRAAGAGRAMLLPPRIRVADQQGFLRYLSAGIAVLTVLGPSRADDLLPDLRELADAVDAEALRGHPANEVFHNPAKSLAVRMRARRVVLAGDSPSTAALARHGAEVLMRTAGAVVAAADLGDVVASATRFASGGSGVQAAGYDPIFHDEELDGPPPSDPVRVFVLSSVTTKASASRRIAVLPDAELVLAVADDEQIDEGGREMTGERSEIEQLAVMAVRLEMAAAYLQLIGGS